MSLVSLMSWVLDSQRKDHGEDQVWETSDVVLLILTRSNYPNLTQLRN